MDTDDNDYSTLEEMRKHFEKKTKIVSECLEYRTTEEIPAKIYNNLEAAISQLHCIFKEVREELRLGQANVTEMQNLLQKVEGIHEKLNHMEKNYPTVLKKPITVPEKVLENIPASVLKENGASQKLTNNKQVASMAYVTLPEFDSVPKYMKGRIKYEQINKFVDDFNEVIEKKYQLLKLPRKELKLPQLHLVQKLKSQENTETKGSYFCTGEDLKEYKNIKIDKTTSNIITILRHCLKVKEIRSPGLIRYAIVV